MIVSTLFLASILAVSFSSIEEEAKARLNGLVDAVNSGDLETMSEFVGTCVSPSLLAKGAPGELANRLWGLWRQHQGLTLSDVRADSHGQAEGVVEGKLLGRRIALAVSVDRDPPHRIKGISLRPLPSAPSDEGPLSREGLIGELKEFLEKAVSGDQFSGTVLVAHRGESVLEAAYGDASKRFSVPNRIDTRFNLGSMNKMFTAVAIMQLVETGDCALEDPIRSYIAEDWFDSNLESRVQVQHLLCHTSGLGSYFNREYARSSRDLFRLVDDYKPLVRGETLAFTPGTNFQYSNTGFMVAGAVIEGASGEDYFDYVRKFIYEPAGMESSDCYDMDEPVPNLAIGYSTTVVDGKTEYRNNYYSHVIRGGPAGGGFSTVHDLLAFAKAMLGNELVSEESRDILWSAKPDLGSPSYGFGFTVSDTPAGRAVGHSGGFSGISSTLRLYLDRDFVLCVMSNYDEGAQLVLSKFEGLLGRLAEQG